jgi:hypothetical protein
MPQTPPAPDGSPARYEAVAKRDYHAPELRDLGKLTEVTATNPGGTPYDSGDAYAS